MGGATFTSPAGCDSHPDYPGKSPKYFWLTATAAAVGGIIFGYDTAISGGVALMAGFLKPFFPSVYWNNFEEADHSTDQYCKFKSDILSLFTSSLFIAAIFACPFTIKLSKKYGQRITMLVSGIVFLMGAILSAAALHVSMLILGRILVGIGVGFFNQLVPLYLSELVPNRYRDICDVLFQLLITVGILIANLVNFGTAHIPGGWGWRLSLGGAAIPALFLVVVSFFCLSDTPSSLLNKGEKLEAKEQKHVREVENIDIELGITTVAACSKASKQVEYLSDLFKKWYQYMYLYDPQLTMSIVIPLCQQLTGVNALIFYAPVLFKTLGFGSSDSLILATIVGFVNVAAAFTSVYGSCKWGWCRRPLFIAGGALIFVFQMALLCLLGYSGGEVTNFSGWFAGGVVLCICLVVAAYAISWGTLGWLFLSEILRSEVRCAAQTLSTAVNMICSFLMSHFFLILLCGMRFTVFFFLALFVFLMTCFFAISLPETKNIPPEEMPQIWRRHCYWTWLMERDDIDHVFANDKDN